MFKVGNVFCLPADGTKFTHPKYVIVVGGNSDYVALVFINTEIAYTDITEELQGLSYPISTTQFPWLKYDSYVDCSDLVKKEKRELHKILQKDSKRIYADLPVDFVENIIDLVKRAKSITLIDKKDYGIIPK